MWINDPRERLWRGILVVLGFLVVATSRDANLFGLFPIATWCALARSWRTGIVVGAAILALLVWFVVPRGLGWTGPWVPSALEIYWVYSVMAAVLSVVGLAVERAARPAPTLVSGFSIAGYVVLGFAGAAFLGIMNSESKPRDEGVLPGPAALQVVEGDAGCGSGHCWRTLDATGDRAPEVMRAHLASRGYVPRSEHWCRRIGLVVAHEVCADLRKETPTSVHVIWYNNRNAE
ncbi:hypothetical protein [Lentzea terrae]|uniref:hypothetical protein n=1 Tax=Lentzea terrae TaxID=2200761 RepID=UPI000DD2ED9E|nr:hypothetical protein [Lentzea terrae]